MAVSCEERRTSAYSADLRWRMVYQVKALGKSYQEVAESLNVDKSTVSRIVALYESSSDVTPKRYPPNSGTSTLTEVDKFIILELVIDRPGIYLREIQRELEEQTGTTVDSSTICRFLHNSGFTRRKLSLTAKQRSDTLRAQYQVEMAVYRGHPELLVFLDETGADRRDSMRRFGYTLRGKPARSQKLLWRGERVSAIAAISCGGVLDCYTTHGTVNGDTFCHFLEYDLCPKLQPFNGVNPNSVVVLDNASIHHVQGAAAKIESVGALVYYLPPYSPDFNPIEETFSKVKSVMKAYESADMDAETAILTAFNSIEREDCMQWITHCGYY